MTKHCVADVLKNVGWVSPVIPHYPQINTTDTSEGMLGLVLVRPIIIFKKPYIAWVEHLNILVDYLLKATTNCSVYMFGIGLSKVYMKRLAYIIMVVQLIANTNMP